MEGLNHPNVVEMKDVIETNQHMYIIMEIVEGGELFEHLNDYEITEKEAALVSHQILDALEYLHLCGIVHRDLKP
jgi:calcium/calmodulin-dependent protein kinase I